ncbi:DinB family protein [uncultured Mycobacterium sp.]|uniref:DinB family protein n=1 Tax=uncultured Mycobacterium sp. TaxID=171292 RepID=UPI0035CA30D9
MPALAPPVADERQALREYLAYHQSAYFAVSHGLTDEQARSTPTVSALSIGGLIKHATGMQRTWMARVAAAPEAPPKDTRPFKEIAKEFGDQHVMRPDETLAGLLGAFEEQNARSLHLTETADLDAAVPVPQDIPWFPKNIGAWSVRWVILHVINELARHAGHADIIRESIDGATMYELIAARENWEPQPWLTPWRPRGAT